MIPINNTTNNNIVLMISKSCVVRDMGTPGFPPTRVSTVPDRWAQPTRRPADLSVGPARPDMWAQGHEDNLEYKIRQTSSDKLSLL
jgi:hypothetical protein